MTIGIMTWYQYYNYGTSLQLYALYTVLAEYGADPYVINYCAREKGLDGDISGFVDEVSQKIYHLLHRPIKNCERDNKFKYFLEKNLRFTDKCDTLSELEQLNNWIDVFICGSDQIWAPSCFDPHYFLDFVIDSERTIAYAPSVGLSSIDNSYIRERIKSLSARIAFLSSREKIGAQIISELTGRRVEVTLDPTLLLTREVWQKLAGKEQNSEPYLLVYFLGDNQKYWHAIYSIAKERNLSVKIIPVYKSDYKRDGSIQSPIGPEEFLGLVEGASFICTDSYHGMLFSIQFHKEFCVFKRFPDKSKNNQNSRIFQIVDLFHLRDRVYKSNLKVLLDKGIDYDEVDSILNQKRLESEHYLQGALDIVSDYKQVPSKNNIKKNLTLCCGCGACAAICSAKAIAIEVNEEGFYEAVLIEEKCISCGKCRQVCPYLNRRNENLCDDGVLYSFKEKSLDVLMKSSSGGAAYAIGKTAVLEDFRIVGCCFDKDIQKAIHVVARGKESLQKMQGSKYMQSSFSNIVSDIQNQDKLIVFGTPCQIAAARNLCTGKDVVFVDLICHGVPSYHLYERYQEYLYRFHGIDSKHMDVTFRYKPKGWRNRYIRIDDSHKVIVNHQNKDPYFLCFEYGICYAKSCYECPWRNKSKADIRVGDYWGPRFEKDKTGVSMVLALTDTGNSWIDKLNKQKFGRLERASMEDFLNYQQIYNIGAPVFRDKVFEELCNGNPIEHIIRDYALPVHKIAMRRRKLEPVKKIIKKVVRYHE